MAATVTGWVMLALGVLLAGGGIRLATLGGTWAYIVLGIGWLMTGVLLIARRRVALWSYAALLAFTLVWALLEAGLDRWALAPRLALFWLVGLWLLTPCVSRPLTFRTPRRETEADVAVPTEPVARTTDASDRRWRAARRHWFAARAWLGAATALVLVVGLMSMSADPFDVPGAMPAPLAVNTTPVAPSSPADDWTVYGGTAWGQRYSTLADITPSNVSHLKLAWTFHTGDKKGPDDPDRDDRRKRSSQGRRHALLVLQARPRDCARPGDRGEALGVRSEDPGEPRLPGVFQLSRPGLSRRDRAAGSGRRRRGASSTAPPAGNVASAATPLAAASSAPSVASAIAVTCLKRVILPSIDARLFALDAATGQPCAGFGKNGIVELTSGIGNFKPATTWRRRRRW